MNYQEYIESGKLDAYVLGYCTPEEALEAECMARVFPEVKQELAAIRAAFESHAMANKVAPPANLKSKIFDAIEQTEPSTNESETKIVNINKPHSASNHNLKYMMAASVALLLLFGYGIFNLYSSNANLSDKLSALQQQQTETENSLAANKSLLTSTQNQLAIVSNPNALPVAMKGLPNSPKSLATVYWNKDTKEIFLSVNSLPVPQPGLQYQLWAIVNGAPVDLGVFNLPTGDSLLQKMKSVDNASAFAVTLEKEGGSATPTMDQMYVLGNS